MTTRENQRETGFLRKALGLAVDAAKVEARRLMGATAPTTPIPAVDPEPAPEPPPAAKPEPWRSSKWSSPQFHVEALASTTCPDCGGAKKVGAYRCVPCRKASDDRGEAIGTMGEKKR